MNIMMKDIPISERPRERLLKYGPSSLSNEELLSIILKTGTKNKSVRILAIELLKEINNIKDLNDITINRLVSIKGIGITKAIEVLSSIELGKRIYLDNEELKMIKMTNPQTVFQYTKYLFQNKKQEHFYCLYFDTKQKLIEKKLLFIGTINKSIVHPREVFKYAYLLSASSIVCIHNHPSNDLIPSKEDILLTDALVNIGYIQNIPILDHIIVGNYNYYSFNEHNKISRIKGGSNV